MIQLTGYLWNSGCLVPSTSNTQSCHWLNGCLAVILAIVSDPVFLANSFRSRSLFCLFSAWGFHSSFEPLFSLSISVKGRRRSFVLKSTRSAWSCAHSCILPLGEPYCCYSRTWYAYLPGGNGKLRSQPCLASQKAVLLLIMYLQQDAYSRGILQQHLTTSDEEPLPLLSLDWSYGVAALLGKREQFESILYRYESYISHVPVGMAPN